MSETTIPCPDLDEALEFFTRRLGFRLDMIFPADAPRVAVVSGNGVAIRLEGPRRADENAPAASRVPIISRVDDAKWISGRAGMQYRDLIPSRLGGLLIGSHIKLRGGPVADHVHYHKVAFQIIYCWRGRVKVVYEDQGGPIWLEPGDCVLQPPEIRHRVLESADGTEVIEVTSPAIHETWIDHDVSLPNGRVDTKLDFNGQRFMLHRSAGQPSVQADGAFNELDIAVGPASGGAVRAVELFALQISAAKRVEASAHGAALYFVLEGEMKVSLKAGVEQSFVVGDSIVITDHTGYTVSTPPHSRLLCVIIPASLSSRPARPI